MSGRDYLGDALALRSGLEIGELVVLLRAQDRLRELLAALTVDGNTADALSYAVDHARMRAIMFPEWEKAVENLNRLASLVVSQ